MNPTPYDDEHTENAEGDTGCDSTCVVAELVMPFVTVASKNGPHDEVSYVAGWEMGALYTELEYNLAPQLERVIHTSNAAQADLIAMHHGYIAEIEPTGQDSWSTLRLTRTGVD